MAGMSIYLKAGFTLIELSIVLVIIGLIVGGVLVGQDLIKAAEVRSQINQIEKYQTAVNTFKLKYGYLPGDMPATVANSFGFWSGSSLGCDGSDTGKRNGNGFIEQTYLTSYAWEQNEQSLFWFDIGNHNPALCGNGGNQACNSASLIDFTIPVESPAYCISGWSISIDDTPNYNAKSFIPAAKIGNNNYIYVYNGNGFNWFGIITPPSISAYPAPSFGITPMQAYNIDKKVDDAQPTSGNIQASYSAGYIAGNPKIYCPTSNGANCQNPPASYAPASDTATSCYNTTNNSYSTTLNNGTGFNCALSFKFQ